MHAAWGHYLRNTVVRSPPVEFRFPSGSAQIATIPGAHEFLPASDGPCGFWLAAPNFLLRSERLPGEGQSALADLGGGFPTCHRQGPLLNLPRNRYNTIRLIGESLVLPCSHRRQVNRLKEVHHAPPTSEISNQSKSCLQNLHPENRKHCHVEIVDKACRHLMALLFLLFVAEAFPNAVRAGEIDPFEVDCSSLIRSDELVQSWEETVELENCDRIQRLARIARVTSPGSAPRFYVDRIVAGKIPDISVEVPVVRVVFPQRVFFDTAAHDIRPEGLEVVRIVVEALKYDPPDAAIFVAGHTDPRGGRDFNQSLSVDRANAIAEAIRDSGVRTGKIWRVGFGPDMPLVPNTGEESWGYNRRVEFLFAAKELAIGVWLAETQLENLCSADSVADSDACKRTLNFRNQYDAVEVRPLVQVVDMDQPKEPAPSPHSKQTEVVPRDHVTWVRPQGRVIAVRPQSKTALQSRQSEQQHVDR